MKRTFLSSLLILLAAGTAGAQVDPEPDGLGIYFDPEATSICADYVGSGTLTTYLSATNVGQPGGVAGWEARLVTDTPDLLFLSAEVVGTGPINLFTAPDFQVGLGVPLACAPVLVLATVHYFVMVPGTVGSILVQPCSHPSLPGVACYAAGQDPDLLVPFHSVTGGWDGPAARVNACGIIGARDDSWGGVKALYR